MRYDSEHQHRRSIRLPGHSYRSQGAYFVTACSRGRMHLFDDSVASRIITDVWYAVPGWFPTIALDEFVVMPNHVHLIVWLCGPDGTETALAASPDGFGDLRRAGAGPAPTWTIPAPKTVDPNPTLGAVVGALKSLTVTVHLDWIQSHDPTRQGVQWQRNYYDHVIRNERELEAIRRYIRANPERWACDPDNPDNISRLSPPSQIEDYLADVETLMT